MQMTKFSKCAGFFVLKENLDVETLVLLTTFSNTYDG